MRTPGAPRRARSDRSSPPLDASSVQPGRPMFVIATGSCRQRSAIASLHRRASQAMVDRPPRSEGDAGQPPKADVAQQARERTEPHRGGQARRPRWPDRTPGRSRSMRPMVAAALGDPCRHRPTTDRDDVDVPIICPSRPPRSVAPSPVRRGAVAGCVGPSSPRRCLGQPDHPALPAGRIDSVSAKGRDDVAAVGLQLRPPRRRS